MSASTQSHASLLLSAKADYVCQCSLSYTYVSHVLVLQAIYTLGPLVIAFSVGNLGRYNNQVLLSGRTSDYCDVDLQDGSLVYNHAVLVVGYQNSTELVDGTKAGGSFIIKNSWNVDWGVAGATP